jgi:hypothetical protein
MGISWYFTVLVSDHQYQVSDRIELDSIWLKFSRCQTFNAYSRGVIYDRNIVITQATDFFSDESNREALEYC